MLTEVDLVVKLSTGFERGKGPLWSVRASVENICPSVLT